MTKEFDQKLRELEQARATHDKARSEAFKEVKRLFDEINMYAHALRMTHDELRKHVHQTESEQISVLSAECF